MAGPCRPTNDTLPASDRLTPLGENSSVSPCVERTVQSPAFTASDLERLRYWTSTKRPPYPTADAPTTMQPMPETRWLRQLSELSVGGGSWCWSAINPHPRHVLFVECPGILERGTGGLAPDGRGVGTVRHGAALPIGPAAREVRGRRCRCRNVMFSGHSVAPWIPIPHLSEHSSSPAVQSEPAVTACTPARTPYSAPQTRAGVRMHLIFTLRRPRTAPSGPGWYFVGHHRERSGQPCARMGAVRIAASAGTDKPSRISANRAKIKRAARK